MLRIFYGKAGTGKSTAAMAEIMQAVKNGRGGYIFLVPEQYSHDAERELCAMCGDSMSMYAEVLSFTGLARRLNAELGGGAEQYLDKGGRLLCMALAADGLYSRLRVYSAARRKPELQSMLLSALDELKTACISTEMLLEAAQNSEGALADKLHDLALIQEAYGAIVANGHADPTDRLDVLAQQIAQSSIDENTHIYIDGFTDFTAQERRVIEELLIKGADTTVCLGCDDLTHGSEVFELSRITASALIRCAEEHCVEVSLRRFEPTGRKSKALEYYADKVFSYTSEVYPEEVSNISIHTAGSINAECEFAAAQAISLVRETGCRWRDIAVAVRGFDDYRLPLESAFAHYGVPLYTARKCDLMSKPLPALIAAAYEIIDGGWDADDIIDYMRTGLAGLDDDECDELENYILMWQLRGSVWTKNEDWKLNPDGYGAEYTPEVNERLRHINMLRRTVSEPLAEFAAQTAEAQTAEGQAAALAKLLERLGLAAKLEEKTKLLNEQGRESAAQEYAQLWDIIVSALEQCAAILGETSSDRASFGRLFTLMLSKYDVGTIPAALDRVTAGDFDRMRRRNIKHLIVLGACDTRLPRAEEDTGVFTGDERKRLLEMEIDLGGVGDSELWREFSVIYNCLSLPSDSLSFCYGIFDGSGKPQRAAYVVNRARAMFGLEAQFAETAQMKINAPAPALELAANALRGGTELSAASAKYYREVKPEHMQKLYRAADMSRGSLSSNSVRRLYGDKLYLSASRIDKFASCRFAYFMQYGLKAKPRKPAAFSAPEMGIFMHYILENVASEVMQNGGFAQVSDEELESITDKYIKTYVHENLNDFKEKTKRFEYLFRRLTKDVRRVVADMAEELRSSDFVPLSFELDFGKTKELPDMKLGDGEESLVLTGIADRVDGWVHNDKLYLRVVDYKTGKKSFSLSDVWYGMGLQMLLYLFSLGENGHLLYGREIVPAGVLYIPARDVIISADENLDEIELEKKKAKEKKRSGLLLNDPEVLNAMEHGDSPKFIPVSFKNGEAKGDSIASAEQLGLLAKHIEKTLVDMAAELKGGSIAADPYYRSQQVTACTNCDYREACHFSDGENGECHRNMPNLKATKVWNMFAGGEDNG